MALPSDFKQVSEFRKCTGELFLEKFSGFIDKTSRWGGADELLDKEDKSILMQFAQSALDTRGIGTRSWLMLQSYRQCLNEQETLEHLDQITQIAVAFYSKFVSYETLDDLPAHDNDHMRRGMPSLWSRYGEENAILFACMLDTFSNHLIFESTLEDRLKIRVSKELGFADARTLYGASIHMKPEEVDKPDALQITEKAHGLKTASSTACICGAAAIAAYADESLVERMKELGKQLGYCAQIINDASNEDITHDIAHNAPNIIVAAGRNDLRKGLNIAGSKFLRLMASAKNTIASFPEPNIYLSEILDDMEKHYRKKCQAFTLG